MIQVNRFSYRIEILFLSFVYFLFIARLSIPYVIYLFIPAFLVLVFYSLMVVVLKQRIHISTNLFVKPILFYLLSLIFIASSVLTIPFPSILFKGISEVAVLFLFFFISVLLINDKEKYSLFEKHLFNLLIIGSVLVSFFGLIKYFFDIKGDTLFWLSSSKYYNKGVSLVSDYNFFALFLLIGLFIIIYKIYKNQYSIKLVFYSLLPVILLILTIFLSYSRRGLFVLSGLLVVGVFILLLTIATKKHKNNLVLLLKIVYISLFLGTTFVLYTFNVASDNFKDYFLLKFFKKDNFAKYEITKIVHRYQSMFINRNFNDLHIKLWKSEDRQENIQLDSNFVPVNYFPINPDKAWIKRPFKKIYPITGKNYEIIPDLSIGFLFDSTTKVSTWKSPFNIDLINLYVQTHDFNTKSDKYYLGMIYAYISNDFNAEEIIYSVYHKNKVSRYFFNHSLREEWQRAYVLIKPDSSIYNLKAVLSFAKKNTTTIDSLKGYIAFACPMFYEFDTLPDLNLTPKLISSYSTNENNKKSINVRYRRLLENYMLKQMVKDFKNSKSLTENPIISELQFLRRLYDVSENKKQIHELIESKYNHQQSFLENQPIQLFFDKGEIKVEQHKVDAEPYKPRPLNVLISKYLPIKSNFEDSLVRNESKISDTIFVDNQMLASRAERWKFAWQLYTQEYTFAQKLFGNGFQFLSIFGNKFYNNPNRYDWPHNPFLSVLLYSGLFGLVFFVLFLVQVVTLYYKYRNELMPFIIIFILSFYFVFFSGTYFFDTPTWAVSLIIPLFYSLLNKKADKGETVSLLDGYK